jgi:hypothetical protein
MHRGRRARSLSLLSMHLLRPGLECVSSDYFQGHRAKPLWGLFGVRKSATYPDPSPRSPPSRIPRRPGGLPIRAQRCCKVLLRPVLFPGIGLLQVCVEC